MSSFKAKQRDTHATRRKTAQRHAVTGDEIDGPMLRRVPNALPDELVSAATGGSTTGEIGGGGGGSEPWPASVAPHHGLSLPPARPQEIYVVPSGADKRQVLREMLARLRAAEKSARQKTRVLVLVSTPATARALEALVGHMVAKKTPSRGHQRRCGGGKAAGGAATRTAWEHKDAATLMQGMQQDYSAQVAKEFRAGKILTVCATDGAAAAVLRGKPSTGIHLVISFDPPRNFSTYRLRCDFAGHASGRCVLFYCGTRAEQEATGGCLDDIMAWMARAGAVLPREVADRLGIGGLGPTDHAHSAPNTSVTQCGPVGQRTSPTARPDEGVAGPALATSIAAVAQRRAGMSVENTALATSTAPMSADARHNKQRQAARKTKCKRKKRARIVVEHVQIDS